MANEIVNQIAHRQPVRPAVNLPKAPNECICVRVGYLDVYYGLVATDANNYTYLIIDKNTVAAGQVIPPVGLEHLREWIHDLPYVNDTNDTAIPEKVYRRIADIGPADFSVYEATTGSTNPLKAHIFIPLVASAPAGAGRQTDPVKREFGHITPDPQPVKVTPQNFTEEQKAQARQNIGAVPALPLPAGYIVTTSTDTKIETNITAEDFAEYFSIPLDAIDYLFASPSFGPRVTNVCISGEEQVCILSSYTSGSSESDAETWYYQFAYNSSTQTFYLNWEVHVVKHPNGTYNINSHGF